MLGRISDTNSPAVFSLNRSNLGLRASELECSKAWEQPQVWTDPSDRTPLPFISIRPRLADPSILRVPSLSTPSSVSLALVPWAQPAPLSGAVTLRNPRSLPPSMSDPPPPVPPPPKAGPSPGCREGRTRGWGGPRRPSCLSIGPVSCEPPWGAGKNPATRCRPVEFSAHCQVQEAPPTRVGPAEFSLVHPHL